jgi:hypothetical protein
LTVLPSDEKLSLVNKIFIFLKAYEIALKDRIPLMIAEKLISEALEIIPTNLISGVFSPLSKSLTIRVEVAVQELRELIVRSVASVEQLSHDALEGY